MSQHSEKKTVEQLLAEAEELIQQINADALDDMKEEHRIQFEKHFQNFNRVKVTAEDKIVEHGKWKIRSSLDGIHEALEEIVTAMHDLKKYISNTN